MLSEALERVLRGLGDGLALERTQLAGGAIQLAPRLLPYEGDALTVLHANVGDVVARRKPAGLARRERSRQPVCNLGQHGLVQPGSGLLKIGGEISIAIETVQCR